MDDLWEGLGDMPSHPRTLRRRNIEEVHSNINQNNFNRKKPRLIADILSSDDDAEEEEIDPIEKIQKSRMLKTSPNHNSTTSRIAGLSLGGCNNEQDEEGISNLSEEETVSPQASPHEASSHNDKKSTSGFVSFAMLAAQAPSSSLSNPFSSSSRKFGSSNGVHSIGVQDPFKGIHSPWVDQHNPGHHHHNNPFNTRVRKQQYGVNSSSMKMNSGIFKSPVITLPALRRGYINKNQQEEGELEYIQRKENNSYRGSQPIKTPPTSIPISLLTSSKNQLLVLLRFLFMMIGIAMTCTFIWSKMTYIPGFQTSINAIPRMFSASSSPSHHHHHHHVHPSSDHTSPSDTEKEVDKEEASSASMADGGSNESDVGMNGTLVISTSDIITTSCDTCDKFISAAYEWLVHILVQNKLLSTEEVTKMGNPFESNGLAIVSLLLVMGRSLPMLLTYLAGISLDRVGAKVCEIAFMGCLFMVLFAWVSSFFR